MDAIPGRHRFLEFVAKNGTLSRTRFLGRHAAPALLVTSESYARAADFKTTDASPPAGTRAGPAEQPFYLYFVEKRPGADTKPAVTVGRAPTNDIIVSDPGVSRSHCALYLQKDGLWTLEDSSSTGTWVDGEKLDPRRRRWLGESASLKLGPAVFLSFVSAERLFELITRTLPR